MNQESLKEIQWRIDDRITDIFALFGNLEISKERENFVVTIISPKGRKFAYGAPTMDMVLDMVHRNRWHIYKHN